MIALASKVTPLTRNILQFRPKTYNNLISRCSGIARDETDASVGYWLLGISGLVAGMVAVGGITRLTKSGLSMTDWKLQGSLPPLNEEEWNKEFERYKQFPEWKQRKSMDIGEFKYIYFWEYSHRMMGRFIGLSFAIPFAYFAYKGRISRQLFPRISGLFCLGGFQGLVGWWMVRSGLNEELVNSTKEIRVSPYRLATHLGVAFSTFSLALWTALDILMPATSAFAVAKALPPQVVTHAMKIRRFAIINTALVGITAFSGAFVAGNDGGRAYNTFPLMGDEWIPSEILDMKPTWRNFFENTATVQFDHRVLALSTLSSIALTFHTAYNSTFWASLPRVSRTCTILLAGMSGMQVTLGITTLLTYVPISLGVLHQAGSLALLTASIFAVHSYKFSKFKNVIAQVTKRI